MGGPGAAWPRAYEGERWEGPGRAGKKRGERGTFGTPSSSIVFPKANSIGGGGGGGGGLFCKEGKKKRKV